MIDRPDNHLEPETEDIEDDAQGETESENRGEDR